MHALLVYANKPRITYGFLPGPYGLETIRAYLAAIPVECRIINPFLSLDPKAATQRAVGPDTILIGISVRNLDDCLVLWNPELTGGEIQSESCIDDVKEVIGWCRDAAPEVPIVVGGAAFAATPHRLLWYLGVDVGFVGAAEDDFVHLIAELVARRRPFDKIVRGLPSAVFRNLEHRSGHGPVLAKTHDRIPVVDRESVYFQFRQEAAVRTFSGCPLSCSHCVEHLATRKISRSPVEIVADEVEGVIARYADVKRVFFADSEVNLAGEERTEALIREIRRRPAAREIPLVGYFNPRPMSFDLLESLSRAGCEVRLTIDHVSDTILSRNGKNFRNSHLRSLVSHYADLGMELSFCLLLGQPGETRETIDEVLEFVEAIPATIRGPVYFSPGVRVYPGTPIERDLTQQKLDKRWLVGRLCAKHPFVKPLVYCESWHPVELFDYVRSKAHGLLKPMNAYLSDLDAPEKMLIDEEFRNYHIGIASMGADESTSWAAWSTVRARTPFLSLRQRTEFLWARGRMALERGLAEHAQHDWILLRSILRSANLGGSGLEKLQHNISVAQKILK